MCSLERESVQLIVHRLWTIGSLVLVVAYKIQIGGVIYNIVHTRCIRYSGLLLVNQNNVYTG